MPTAVGVQFPWETHPGRSHEHIVEMETMIATKYPITNEEYRQFLEESGWRPSDPHNWLRHWVSTGEAGLVYEEGEGRKPVIWVSVRDAETFCHHYDMRTPTPWEWQWIAEGPNRLGGLKNLHNIFGISINVH